MTEDLRKVKYHLDDGFREYNPDATSRDEEHNKERTGWFHKWTSHPAHNPLTGEEYITDHALVEDAETGEVHIVKPSLIIFDNQHLA